MHVQLVHSLSLLLALSRWLPFGINNYWTEAPRSWNQRYVHVGSYLWSCDMIILSTEFLRAWDVPTRLIDKLTINCLKKWNPEIVVRRFSFEKSILKKFPAQEIFKNTFFTEHLRVAASGTKNTLLKKYSRQLVLNLLSLQNKVQGWWFSILIDDKVSINVTKYSVIKKDFEVFKQF